VEIRAIAVVRSSRVEAVDDGWDGETTRIELVDDVPDEALIGLDSFSHVEIVAVASLAADVPPAPWSRRPRGNPDWPEVGVFAQRNKDRPNRLLVSVAQLGPVNARSFDVRGLDLIDGTPVVDIKPVFSWTQPRGTLRTARWSDEIGRGYFTANE
jgi:tRNA (Thr-GGU) A37 N-methylase